MTVFISHSSTDTWVAERIAERVEDIGAHTFLDEQHIALGEDFEEVILAALAEADELLVLLTPWATDRPYVGAEIGAAWGQRKPIIGILHGLAPSDLRERTNATALLKEKNLTTLNDIDRYFQELSGRLRATGQSREVS